MLLLLRKGADLTATDHHGFTALHWAAYKIKFETVSLCLALGLLVDTKDGEGRSVVHIAALVQSFELTQTLLAEVESMCPGVLKSEDNEGRTPVQCARKMQAGRVAGALVMAEKGSYDARSKLCCDNSSNWTAGEDEDENDDARRGGRGGKGKVKKGGRVLEWAFVFLWVNMLFGWYSLPMLLLPCVAVATSSFSSITIPTTIVANALMLYFLLHVSFADPGVIGRSSDRRKEYEKCMHELIGGGKDKKAGGAGAGSISISIRGDGEGARQSSSGGDAANSSGTSELSPPLVSEEAVRLCHTCLLVRPVRAKHCSVTNRCVREFDHYCPYVNNCVGERTFPAFCAYILCYTVATGRPYPHSTLHTLSTLYSPPSLLSNLHSLHSLYSPPTPHSLPTHSSPAFILSSTDFLSPSPSHRHSPRSILRLSLRRGHQSWRTTQCDSAVESRCRCARWWRKS
jgi:palmitoyltransferase